MINVTGPARLRAFPRILWRGQKVVPVPAAQQAKGFQMIYFCKKTDDFVSVEPSLEIKEAIKKLDVMPQAMTCGSRLPQATTTDQ